MFNSKPQPKDLNSILGVFYQAQDDLKEFVETRQVEKEAVEARLASINSDVKKSHKTLEALASMLD